MATERDNDVIFKMTGVSDMEFDISDHNIHGGQPWSGVKSITGEDEITMTIGAGRKSSETSAEQFKKWCKGGMAIVCSPGGGTWPNKLNFAFIGTMRFKHGGQIFEGTDIVMGQGSAGATNNWWLGGPHMEGMSIAHVAGAIGQTFKIKGKIVAGPAKAYFSVYGTSSNTFNGGTLSL